VGAFQTAIVLVVALVIGISIPMIVAWFREQRSAETSSHQDLARHLR
jgi:hypothetical protein